MRAIDMLAQDLRYAAAQLCAGTRLHRGRPAHARARHRREHGDLQRRPRRAAAAAAVRARRPAGRGPPAGAEDRRRQRGRVGEGDRRITAPRPASLDAVVEYHQMSFNMLGRGEASRVQTGVVSANFFEVLGVTPILGRTFRADDDSPNAPAVLVLSYAYLAVRAWRRPRHRRPHVRAQRSHSHGGRRAAADAAVPGVGSPR